MSPPRTDDRVSRSFRRVGHAAREVCVIAVLALLLRVGELAVVSPSGVAGPVGRLGDAHDCLGDEVERDAKPAVGVCGGEDVDRQLPGTKLDGELLRPAGDLRGRRRGDDGIADSTWSFHLTSSSAGSAPSSAPWPELGTTVGSPTAPRRPYVAPAFPTEPAGARTGFARRLDSDRLAGS